jgi:hypothetical protein
MFSNLVLDNKNALTTPGNPIIQWTDNGNDAQRWTINYTGSSYYKLLNKASNLPLDVDGDSITPGATVVQDTDNGSTSQRWKLEQDKIVRYESKNIAENYIRTSSNRIKISYRDDFRSTPFNESEWRIVPGLADATCISIESVSMPGYFLRHRNGEVWIDQKADTDTFKADATWRVRTGLADSTMISFETYNFAGQYLRHRDGQLWITAIATDLDKADATFKECR